VAHVSLQQVSKVYGKGQIPAVKALGMEIADGEIIALLGSSGCGKTSTLRMIAGFERVSSGSICIGTRCVNDMEPAARGVAMAFEGYALYPPLTVYDNIAFALLRGKMPRAQVQATVRHIADLLEIGPILASYPPMLSGGQQQRVSLARALARQADVYLLDEPMSQLEPELRAVLRARIKEYLLAQRMTAILVTHDQTEAMALADRVAVMSDGVLQQFAAPAQLGARPANRFVAGFIGEPAMNLLKARIARRGEDAAVVVHAAEGREDVLRVDISHLLRQHPEAALHDGQPVHLGVRAHQIVPGCDGARADVCPARATLALKQWQGDQTHWRAALGGGQHLLIVSDGAAGLHDDWAIGTARTIGLPLDALHIFDGISGAALLHGGAH